MEKETLEGYGCWFSALAVVNSSAVNMAMQAPLWIPTQAPLGWTQVWVAGSYSCILGVWCSLRTDSAQDARVHALPSSEEAPSFLPALVCLLILAILTE